MKNKSVLLLTAIFLVMGLGKQLDMNPTAAWAQSRENQLKLEPMNLDKLETILRSQVPDIQGRSGQWQFAVNSIPLIVLADGRANRMRVVALVRDVGELEPDQIQKMLIANFHTTLDGRYAIRNNSVIATYVHPLDSLQERDLLSALNQVLSLVTTFGTTYSSGELIFAPNPGERPQVPSEGNIAI